MGKSQSSSGGSEQEKILDPTGTKTSQPEASRYTDCTIRAPEVVVGCFKTGFLHFSFQGIKPTPQT
jgi:hypothetical protein